MRLHSPQSAILSAVIFNALIIVALIPLALRGVRYRPASASAMLRRNIWIYGLGGVILPFLGIKAIDLVVQFLPGIGDVMRTVLGYLRSASAGVRLLHRLSPGTRRRSIRWP